MKGTIPKSFINDLLVSTDIVEIIGQRIRLKKAGREYQACCPFHQEKTPSFTISQLKQFYHCFGCGVHGNAISFIMQYENFEYVEAIEELARIKGLEVPYLKINKEGAYLMPTIDYKYSYSLLAEIKEYYQQQLALNDIAKEYLINRELTDKIIQRYAIGYAPNSFNAILTKFGQTERQRQVLFDTGMLSRSDNNREYDKFSNRIMFPIQDKRGRVLGFGGRVLDNNNNKPKYLNSPETKIFHKGQELYGLYQVLQINNKPSYLLVVEGYMDVVALAQFGVDNAVASLGTATTEEQIKTAFKLTDKIICCYDGDRAGKDAAWRALNNALTSLVDGKQIEFIFLPDDEDPDSYVRKYGLEQFQQLLNQAIPLSEFIFNKLLAQVDLSSKEGKAKLSELAIPLILKIPGITLQMYLRQQLGNTIGIKDESQLQQIFANYQKQDKSSNDKVIRVAPKLKQTPMRLLIALLIQHPELIKLIPDLNDLKTLNESGFDIFYQLSEYCRQNIGITTGQLVEYWRERPEFNIIQVLASWDHGITDKNLSKNFSDTLDFLFKKLIKKKIDELIAKDRTEGLLIEEKQELLALQKFNLKK